MNRSIRHYALLLLLALSPCSLEVPMQHKPAMHLTKAARGTSVWMALCRNTDHAYRDLARRRVPHGHVNSENLAQR